MIINFRYWSVSFFCDPSASCSIQVSLDTRCRLSPDEELVCFLKASWLSKIFSHLGHGKESLESLGACKTCVPTFFPQSQKSFHRDHKRFLLHLTIYCGASWHMMLDILVVATGGYYIPVVATGGPSGTGGSSW